jgi:SAM-dependent methyltransferase
MNAKKPDPLEAQDALYTNQWCVESSGLTNAGAYHAAMDFVPCNDGDIHIDIGCGSGAFLAGLRARNPNIVPLGVDRNKKMVQKSEPVFQMAGIPLRRYGSQRTVRKPGKSPRTLFTHDDLTDPAHIEELLTPNGTIRFILDDIRTTRILHHVLSGRQIQSCSFLFPGISRGAAHEAPYPPGGRDRDEIKRVSEIGNQTREAAMKIFARYLTPGGSLVIAERLLMPPEDEVVLSVANIRAQLGKCAEYFDIPEEVVIIRNIPTSNPLTFERIQYFDPVTRRLKDQNELKKHAFVHRSFRNNVPFTL